MAPEWPSTRYRNEAARAWPRGCVHATRGTRGRRGKENIRSHWSRKVIRVFFGGMTMREGVNYPGLSSRKDNRGGGIFTRLIRACVPSTREKSLEEGVVENGGYFFVSFLFETDNF